MVQAVSAAQPAAQPRKSLVGKTMRWAAAGIAAGLLLAACETDNLANGPGTTQPKPPAPPSTSGGGGNSAFSFKTSGDKTFDSWRNTFAGKADAAGRKNSSIHAVLDGLEPIEQQVQAAAFDNQAEFVKPIWDYAKSAVSPTRITNGQAKIAANADTFEKIEASYATPREIVAAIWGMESSYGGYIGDIDAPRAIATQAALGRRVQFNEGELLAIMQLIEDGSATREQFKKGSWAGAVGQTQFMPSTFVQHARDFDRDGKKDLWSNPGDALASAANYLTASGWKKGEPWAVEANVPGNYDYSLGDGRKMTVAEWVATGITPATQESFAKSDALKAELFLPAGSYGPAFLLFDNFSVIKKYNNADSYALAVGLLADRLAGRPEMSRPWPTTITMLTQAQAKELQTALNKLGYPSGTPDGIIGRNTRGALQKFQKAKGLVADGFPTTEMLDIVLAAAA